jgi:hypothetical protein
MLRVAGDYFLELLLGIGVAFLALEGGAAQKPDVFFVILFGGELFGFVEGLLGFARA